MDQVEQVKVLWPNGKTQILKEVDTNQLLQVDVAQAIDTDQRQPSSSFPQFEDITGTSDIQFSHQEDTYDDFLYEPLLPHKNSQIGPALVVGDVNQDGLEDIFVGNAKGKAANMYVQNEVGKFELMSGPWEMDSVFEDTGALFVGCGP